MIDLQSLAFYGKVRDDQIDEWADEHALEPPAVVADFEDARASFGWKALLQARGDFRAARGQFRCAGVDDRPNNRFTSMEVDRETKCRFGGTLIVAIVIALVKLVYRASRHCTGGLGCEHEHAGEVPRRRVRS